LIKRRYILAEEILRGSYPYRHHTDRHGPLRKKYATSGSALLKREQFSIKLLIKQTQKQLNNKNEDSKRKNFKFQSFFNSFFHKLEIYLDCILHTVSIFWHNWEEYGVRVLDESNTVFLRTSLLTKFSIRYLSMQHSDHWVVLSECLSRDISKSLTIYHNTTKYKNPFSFRNFE
jgi:hypothetical protein